MTRRIVECVGVDGCKAGFVSAHPGSNEAVQFVVHPDARALLEAFPDAVIAIDMPIGLPETTGAGGRGPERLIRPLLGGRQSSVFSIPARAAVEAESYAECCRIALLTSDPPRKVSKQGFHLFPKIRELDAVLRAGPADAARTYETHPELVFATLNGAPLATPKKIKGQVNPEGMGERMALLAKAGLKIPAPLPKLRGANADDLLDACAALAAAMRIRAGMARAHPSPPDRDSFGLPIAIWA
ncbi:MAG: DUF429 domain-containing protein [Rhizobiaceae bacterium]|nr:DUF429 domain-containing protein [Rhizobiaceae bacterium]